MGELGGINLYEMCANNLISHVDAFGLNPILKQILKSIIDPTPLNGHPKTKCKSTGAETCSPGAPPAQGPSAKKCSYSCDGWAGDMPYTYTVTVFTGPSGECPTEASIADGDPKTPPPAQKPPTWHPVYPVP